MSAQVPSAHSFNRALARMLALSALVPQSEDVVTLDDELPRDAFKHNVGDCGCGNGACSGGQVCGIVPPPGWGDYGLPDGFTWGQGGVLMLPDGSMLMPPGSATPGDSGPIPVPAMPGAQQMPNPNALPENFATQYAAMYRALLRRLGLRCVPYENAIKDCVLMTPVWSTPVTIAAGATQNVDIQPANGWLDGYYFDISIRTAAGAALPPVAVSMTIPTVVGCATPRCATTGVGSAQFLSADSGECCCGKPFRSIIPRTSEGTPLRTAVTNHTAADAIVQTMVRGFCHATQICV